MKHNGVSLIRKIFIWLYVKWDGDYWGHKLLNVGRYDILCLENYVLSEAFAKFAKEESMKCENCRSLKKTIAHREAEIDRLISEIDDYKGIVWKLEGDIKKLKEDLMRGKQ